MPMTTLRASRLGGPLGRRTAGSAVADIQDRGSTAAGGPPRAAGRVGGRFWQPTLGPGPRALVPCVACHTGSPCDRAGSCPTCSCWPSWSRWSTWGCGSCAGSTSASDQNAVVSERLAEPPAPLGDLLDPDSSADDVAARRRPAGDRDRHLRGGRAGARAQPQPRRQPGVVGPHPAAPRRRLARRREPGLDRQRRHVRRRAPVLRAGGRDGRACRASLQESQDREPVRPDRPGGRAA